MLDKTEGDDQKLDDKDTGFLIVSLKSIYVNTFGLFVIDLLTKKVVFRHESYHLWEANI